jgi:hypothetical protein
LAEGRFRSVRVQLDADLARFYSIGTRDLNQAVGKDPTGQVAETDIGKPDRGSPDILPFPSLVGVHPAD